MNTKAKAQVAVDIIGRKPDFTNKRKGYRTLKWYASPRKHMRKLKAAGVVIHDSHEMATAGPLWVRSMILIKVPVDLSLKDLTDPRPKRVPVTRRSLADLKAALRRRINKLERREIESLCSEWQC